VPPPFSLDECRQTQVRGATPEIDDLGLSWGELYLERTLAPDTSGSLGHV